MKYFALIMAGVLLNAMAQLALKQGMRQIGHFEFNPAMLMAMSWRIGTNPYVMLGLACYVLSVCVWLLVLSRVEVSFAYPMVSIGYIVTAVAAYAFFGEAVTPTRIAGIAIIIFGVYLVSRT
ncbi:MAG: EamA family transporter [Parvibaculaceae bacterium]|nr:EamA family transporter [Parvibaculaceae bacterium]